MKYNIVIYASLLSNFICMNQLTTKKEEGIFYQFNDHLEYSFSADCKNKNERRKKNPLMYKKI